MRHSLQRLPVLLVSAFVATSAQAETFRNLQQVDTNGVGTWSGSFPITLTGVVLNDPDEMLDSTPNFIPWNNGAGSFQLGGQWQIFLQAVLPGDRGGVECWMGQNYGNLPWVHSSSGSYDDTAWQAEVARVSRDAATGHVFRKGDLVTVTAHGSLFRGGMRNINEEHSLGPEKDFAFSLVSSNYGLPAPEVISLASLVNTNAGPTGHFEIFDATRATGGEYWQGMRVRINGLQLAGTNGWHTDADWASRFCTVTDDAGREFTVVHPLRDLGPAPAGRFDATGILMQESGSATDGTFGYLLFLQEIEPSVPAVLDIAMKPVISWPESLGNYQLQYRDSLTSTDWFPATNTVSVVNGKRTVILEAAAPQGFYRLQQVR